MSYKDVGLLFLTSLFKAGLAVEIAACMAFRDVGLWLVKGAHRLTLDGRRQLAALEAE